MDGLNLTSIDQAAPLAANETMRHAFVSELRKVIVLGSVEAAKT